MSEWSELRRREVLRRLAEVTGEEPRQTDTRRSCVTAAGCRFRLGFGQGQRPGRGIRGYNTSTITTFYLAVPAPIDPDDIIITVLGDSELLFGGAEFLQIAGDIDFANRRYIPNMFRDDRNGRHWARVAALDLDYPLDEAVDRWELVPGSGSTSKQKNSRETEPPEVENPLDGFKPKDASDYIARLEGRVLVKSRSHEMLLAEYALAVARSGFFATNLVHPRDLVLRRDGNEWLVEAKILYQGNATDAVRSALGQLFTYRHFLYSGQMAPRLLALFSEPIGTGYVSFLEENGIASVWRDEGWHGSPTAIDCGLIG